jgi:biopolymer transport protein ExbD
MKLLEKPPKKIALNITPLIDVLFILIIFFTVSSTFLEQPGIELKLPDAESSESHTTPKVIIFIDETENVFLNNTIVPLDTLVARVGRLLTQQSDKSVVLRADEGVSHGLVINIMDRLRRSGIYKIVVSTEKPFRGKN